MKHAPILPLLLALAACQGGSDGKTGSILDKAEQVLDENRQKQGKALDPNQFLQGSIQARFNNAEHEFRIVADKVPDDIEQQLQQKMGAPGGQKKLDDANRRMGSKVTEEDLRSMAASMAGKVFANATVTDIFGSLTANLEGEDADGKTLSLALDFDRQSHEFQKGKVIWRASNRMAGPYYESEQASFVIESFQRAEDGSYTVAGRFEVQQFGAGEVLGRGRDGAAPPAPPAGMSGKFRAERMPLKTL